MGINLKSVLYYILLHGHYETPGNQKAYHYDSIVSIDERALTILRPRGNFDQVCQWWLGEDSNALHYRWLLSCGTGGNGNIQGLS